MMKREKAEELKERIRKLEQDIKKEEAKLEARDNHDQISINTTEQHLKKLDKTLYEQKTKVSIADQPDESSKGSMKGQTSSKREQETIKHESMDDYDESKECTDHDIAMRNTTSSVFKLCNGQDSGKNSQREMMEYQDTIEDKFNIKRTNSSNFKYKPQMSKIEDVSESNEMSQNAFESFRNTDNKKIYSRSFSKVKSKENIANFKNVKNENTAHKSTVKLANKKLDQAGKAISLIICVGNDLQASAELAIGEFFKNSGAPLRNTSNFDTVSENGQYLV